MTKRRVRALMTKAISAAIVVFLLVAGLPAIPTAQAVPTDVGYRDFSFAASGVSAPTGQKPQSKLWFADGSWWGALFSVSDSAFTVHRLDWGTQTWSNTGTVIDTRNTARVDTLWDGNALYTVSGTTGTTGVAQVRRFNYNSGTGTFTLASGFPVTVSPNGAESFVFDKDSAGNLWVTWTQDLAVYVTRSSGSETNWVSPFVLPFPGAANLTADDTSAVVAFGSSIGVMWSNQNDETMYFAIHADGAPDSEWSLNPALSLPEYADDHINLKSLQSTSDGRVFAVTKTSLNAASAPLILLLTMSQQGNWSRTTFGTVAENHTRPMLLLDEGNDRIFVFAASPCCSGGTIYYKETSMTNPNFNPGLGNIFIQSSQDPKINNISSTKQPLTAASGLLAIAGDDSTKFYLHNALSLGGAGDVDPPETTISSAPNLTTGDTTATFTFVADEPVSTFECSIDGGPFAGCTSPQVYNGLATGSHLFEVRATDLASNTDPTPATWDWEIGPSTTFLPSSDTYVDAGNPTTNFGTATSLNSDGGSLPEEAFLRFDVTGLSSPVQSATLRVWVTNGTGNGPEVFPASNSWNESTVTWDTKPARTGSAIFDAGSIALGAWYEFDVTAQVIGDGTFTFNLASVSTDGLRFDSREATNPPQLIVQADSTPDSTPPTVSSVDPPDGANDISVSTTVTAVFSEPMDTSTITATSFTLSNGGTVTGTVAYEPTTMTATLTPDGPLSLANLYTATITSAVQDLAGNPLAADYVWTFATPSQDIVPPETTITAGPAAITSDDSATFSFTADETGSTFECSLDSAAFQTCSSPTTYTGLGLGTHHFEVRATDLANNTDPTPATWDWTIDTSAIIDVSIATGTDDAEQRSNGSVTVTSSDLELVEESGKTQIVGIRFSGLGIPQGATINTATLQFTVDEVSTDAASLTIRVEAADNPGPFTTNALDISSRAQSPTATVWNPAPWPTVGESGSAQITPNLSPIVQSAVDRSGWAPNNALVFIIEGSGARVADSYNGNPSGAPLLHIEYDTTPPSVAPTITSFTPTSGAPATSVTVTGSGFNATTQVAFNGTVASFTVTSDTSIDVQVPVGATTGPVSVTNAAGTGTSANDFTVEQRPPLMVPSEYPSIQAAIDAAIDGDTVIVAPGTYPAGITINKTIDLTSNFVATGDPSDVDNTIIQSDGVADGITIGVGAGPTTTIQGFTITSTSTNPDPGLDGIILDTSAEILDNRITRFGDAIDVNLGSGTTVVSCLCARNTIEDNADDAIDLDGAADGLIEDNILRNNGDDGIEIRLSDYAPPLNLTIRNNVITGNSQDGIQLIDEPGASDRRFVIQGNLIADNSRAGLGLMDNSVTTEDYRAASLLDSIQLINNTFSGNDHAVSGGDNLVAVNNIFASSNVGIKGVDGNSIVAYSLFWGNQTDVTTSNVDAATRIDADPLLAADYIPLAGSPAIDAGTAFYAWQGTTVLDAQPGEYSGSSPDLGAYESNTVPDTTPPTVVSTSPFDGETEVVETRPVTATFSEAMDPATVTSVNIALTVQGSTTQLPATVTYDGPTKMATLAPSTQLTPNTTYEATITGGPGGVADAVGNPLAADYVWTFATPSQDIVPPETTITAGPAAITSDDAATFSFTADETGSTFECSLDGGTFTTCTSPVSYASLASGAHHFEVRATDVSGNTDLTPAAWDWTITTSLTFTPIADTYVSEKKPAANFGTDTSLSSDGGNGVLEESLLKFEVTGLSNPVNSATLRIYVTNGTTNGPEIFPADNNWSENTVVWTDKPVRTGVAVVDAGTITKSAWFEFDVTSMITGNGTYTLNLASVSTDGLDFDSREGTNPPELVVEVDAAPDTIPPTVISTVPVDGSTDISTSTSVTAVFSEPMNPATIDAASFTLADGGANVATSATYDAPTMTATLTPTGPLSFGTTYTATITTAATDLNGNPLSVSESWAFTTAATDTVPPETTIFTGPPVQAGSTSASFTFGSDEPGSSFACELDGGGFSACTSPASYTGLSLGAHHFEVRATDPSGNQDATPAVWDWTITSDLTFLPVADTYVNDSRTTKNYGTSLVVISDGGPQIKEALLRFDVTGVGGTVQSAVLRIYATNGTGNGPEVFSADNGWDELTVTWATKPTRSGASIFDAGAIPAGGWYEFDVSGLVTGDGSVTFNLVSVSTDAVKFQSREVAGSEPQLIVTTG